MNENNKSGVITTQTGFNGPLGEVRTIEGPNAIALFRLITIRQGLVLYMKHGMKITRAWRMQLVKEATGLKTNDKQKQLEALDAVIEAHRQTINYVREVSK